MVDVRREELAAWAKARNSAIPSSADLVPVSDDASFRRYFRFSEGADGLVFVDAPPEHEDNQSFVKISGALIAGGLNCPRVIQHDFDLGFLIISDLGNSLYLGHIREKPEERNRLYREAVAAISRMQQVPRTARMAMAQVV